MLSALSRSTPTNKVCFSSRLLLTPHCTSQRMFQPIRSFSKLGDIWRKIKQYVKPDPMYEVKENVNKMIDDSTRGFPGLSGYFFRSMIKRLARRTIDESADQIQWIHQIKEIAEEVILQDEINRKYFGSSIRIYNVQTMSFLQQNHEENHFELRCPVQGNQEFQKGSVFLQGYMDLKTGRIIFYQIRTYDRTGKDLSQQSWDEEDQKLYYDHRKHQHTHQVIDVKGKEVK